MCNYFCCSWVGVCMSICLSVSMCVCAQMCCICDSMMCIKTIAMQSRSAKQQRQKQHHQQQAYPELHKNPSKVPKAIATRLHISICITQHENTKKNAHTYVLCMCVGEFVFLSLLFLLHEPIDNG